MCKFEEAVWWKALLDSRLDRPRRHGQDTSFLFHLWPSASFHVTSGPGEEDRLGFAWNRFAGTPKSWIWVLKGVFGVDVSLGELIPSVDWLTFFGNYQTARATPDHAVCSCPYGYGRHALVTTQSHCSCWSLSKSLRRRVRTRPVPWCWVGNVATGANLHLYREGGHVSGDNEALFERPWTFF